TIVCKVALSILLLIGSLCLISFTSQHIFQKISMDMETKTAIKGMSGRIVSNIYYSSDGKMVSYYSEPEPLIVINNRKGDITMYNIRDNAVSSQQNYIFSTETNQLYYFLDNKKADLGLSSIGYTIKETKFEDGLKVTIWIPPVNLAGEISKVEMVHEKSNPIYMAYYGKNNNPLKKIYFYNYKKLNDYITLPNTVTQINFVTSSDSVIMKTTYSNFKLNQEVDETKLNFVVPANARIAK
ncbi:MAG: LolA family protein, partial [Flammeovirgaceae bacterium]